MKIEEKSLLVFGSRSLNDCRVEVELKKFLDKSFYKYIITALDPNGVCERVKRYAKSCRHGIVLIQVGLDSKRANGMHEWRSKEALKIADHMLVLWDGKSKGTEGEIKMAKKMNVPTTIIRLNPIIDDDLNCFLDIESELNG
jgi:hypothetical protein